MKLILTALYIWCSISLQAQVIKGVVKDNSTGKGIAFLSIGIAGTRVGTLTEKSGIFELTVPDSLKHQNLTLYGLGYKRKDLPISSLMGKTSVQI